MFSLFTKSTAVVIALGVLATSFTPNQVQAREEWYETKGAHVGYGVVAGLIIGNALSNNHHRSSHSRSSYDYRYNSGHSHRSGSSFSYSYSSHPSYYRSYTCRTPYRSSYRSSYTYHHPAPVVYYEPAPVRYVQPAPVYYNSPAPIAAQQGSYINYRQKSAFPFYKKTEIEVIPQLPVVNPDRSQAINNTEFAQNMRQMYQTNTNRSAAPVASNEGTTQPQSTPGGTPAIQEVDPTSNSSTSNSAANSFVEHQVRPAQNRQVTTVSNRAGSVNVPSAAPEQVNTTYTPQENTTVDSFRSQNETNVMSVSYRY
ncbi:MAG: hypothetical protein ACFCU1_05120 [Sumerlaeia bacterium]